MTDTDIRSRLEQLASRELGFKERLPDGELAGALDSVQRLTLVVAIEDDFRICFEPEDEARIHTLNDLVQIIQAKSVEAEAAGEAS